jgi:hypothetical protein
MDGWPHLKITVSTVQFRPWAPHLLKIAGTTIQHRFNTWAAITAARAVSALRGPESWARA